MRDTLRLILFLECNMSCSYCCNEYSSVNKNFQKKYIHEIDFSQYNNICITGGEPFLNRKLLYSLLWTNIPSGKNVFIYTNGTKMTTEDMTAIKFLNDQSNLVQGINIGIHTKDQLRAVPLVESTVYGLIRFKINETVYKEVMRPSKFGWRLNAKTQKEKDFKVEKFSVKEDCSMPNEDWILLRTNNDKNL